MRPKSLILLSLALGCGLVASLGINQVMSKGSPVAQASTEKITVFVAKKEINLNDLISEEMLATKQFPKDAVHKDAITKLDDVKEHRARQKIVVDRPILGTDLLQKGQSARGSEHIPPGMRAVAIKVDATATSGYLVKPGDHVDLMVYLKKSGGGTGVQQTMIKTFMQNVKVFAVDSALTESPDGKGQKSIKTVSLVVSPEQAEVITMASNLGKVTMSIRSPTDGKVESLSRAISLRHVLGSDEAGEEEPLKGDPLAGLQPPSAVKPAGPSWLDVIGKLVTQQKLKPAKEPFVMTVFAGAEVKQFQIVDNNPIPVPMERHGATSRDLAMPNTTPTLPSSTSSPAPGKEDEEKDEI